MILFIGSSGAFFVVLTKLPDCLCPRYTFILCLIYILLPSFILSCSISAAVAVVLSYSSSSTSPFCVLPLRLPVLRLRISDSLSLRVIVSDSDSLSVCVMISDPPGQVGDRETGYVCNLILRIRGGEGIL